MIKIFNLPSIPPNNPISQFQKKEIRFKINKNLKDSRLVISNSINNFFVKKLKNKELEVYHLGGTKVASFDPTGDQTKLDAAHYFYETVPVSIEVKDENGKVKESEVFLYGKTLKKYAKEWIVKTKRGKTTENFQDFAARRMAEDSVKIEKVHIRYFNDEDRQKTEVDIKDGRLTQIGLDEADSKKKNMDGTYAFVLGTVFDEESQKMKKVMFAAPKIFTNQGKIQHSSFLRGGDVLSAGMIKVGEEGRDSISIYNKSGHYKPTEKEIAHLVKHLEESGYDISKIHINYIKPGIFGLIKFKLNIPISWGIVQERADKWLKEKGNSLIEQDLEKINRFNESTSGV